jgi:DNA-binding transcriptional LysR family regulator
MLDVDADRVLTLGYRALERYTTLKRSKPPPVQNKAPLSARDAAANNILNLPKIKISYLQTFVAVADFGSVRGAGRAMGLSSVAVLKALRGLELAVGKQLFHRSASGARLTLDGSELLPRSRLILDEVQQLAADVGLQKTSLSVGLTPIAILFLLGTVLERFREIYPEAQLRLIDGLLSNVIPRLRDGSLDFAFVGASPRALAEDLHFEPCFNTAIAFFANERHPRLPWAKPSCGMVQRR